MFYAAGTKEQANGLMGVLPEEIVVEIIKYVEVLDNVYGSERDYLEVGGYAVVAQTLEDMYVVKDVVDYDRHPCEWADEINCKDVYVSALYLMNNLYSVTVFMPKCYAPDDVLSELD